MHFRIRDVFLPDPQRVLHELYGNDLLQGRLLEFSTGGAPEERFAVVQVDGLDQPLIVPAGRILGRL